jgi:hypothetical protein
MIRRAIRRPAGAEPLVTAPYPLALRPAGDGAGLVWERGAAFVPPAERGAGRMTSRSRSSRLCCSTNLTAKPWGKCLTTRPTQAPTASGIPTRGCIYDETEIPEADMSITKQLRVLPSAKVRVE